MSRLTTCSKNILRYIFSFFTLKERCELSKISEDIRKKINITLNDYKVFSFLFKKGKNTIKSPSKLLLLKDDKFPNLTNEEFKDSLAKYYILTNTKIEFSPEVVDLINKYPEINIKEINYLENYKKLFDHFRVLNISHFNLFNHHINNLPDLKEILDFYLINKKCKKFFFNLGYNNGIFVCLNENQLNIIYEFLNKRKDITKLIFCPKNNYNLIDFLNAIENMDSLKILEFDIYPKMLDEINIELISKKIHSLVNIKKLCLNYIYIFNYKALEEKEIEDYIEKSIILEKILQGFKDNIEILVLQTKSELLNYGMFSNLKKLKELELRTNEMNIKFKNDSKNPNLLLEKPEKIEVSLNHRSSLKKLQFLNFDSLFYNNLNLKSFICCWNLTDNEEEKSSFLEKVKSQYLEELVFEDYSYKPDPKFCLDFILKNFPNLKKLRLKSDDLNGEDITGRLHFFKSSFYFSNTGNLEELIIEKYILYDINKIFCGKKILKKLIINNCTIPDDSLLKENISKNPNMKIEVKIS